MVSIIICSLNPSYLKNLIKNIDKTIGLKYEIISINNQDNKFGICEAYNEGAKRSKYDNLCFIHEDISFQTQFWGEIIVNLLDKKEIGLVGVAGSTYKSYIAAPWISISTDYYRTNIISTANNKFEKHIYNPHNEIYSEVVVIDGLFIATKKKNWELINFNETEIKGFHMYDIDISLKQIKKIIVTHQILIEHISEGNFGENWINNSITYHKKNIKNSISVNNLTKTNKNKLDLFAAQSLFKIQIKNNYSLFKTLKLLIQIFKINVKNKNNWRLIITFLNVIFKKIVY